MNLPIVGNKKECWRKLLILCLFAGILYVIRIPYGLVSDDAVIAQTINSQTLLGNFMDRWQYNGRIFTDVLANLFYRMPMIVWKLFDIAIYILIALLISKIFTEDSWTDISIVCVLILMFPGSYLGSAGYIATTTNYVYPVAGLLGVMYHVSRVRHRQRVSWWQYLITGACILYITNHDQSGMVLIGGLFLYLIYCIVLKENKAVIVNTGVWLLFSVACYIFMFMIPGHIYRMASTAEMERWFPQYADWSLLKKIYHGFSTTVANFLFSNVKLFSLIVLLLFVLALSQDVFYKK